MSRGQATKSMRVLGIMSGTSADGIDVALARISGSPPNLHARLEEFAGIPFPSSVREAILRIASGGPSSPAELSQLNFLLGDVFAEAAIAACRNFRVPLGSVSLIGSHGQTVYHQGRSTKAFGARRVASTMQVGEPAVIAARTGITTVGDFRPADMAVGGQGAPLVPFVDYALYRHPRVGRVALNIGGIANVTGIPADAKPADVIAFDTGPGNMVVDALVRHVTHGRANYDADARLARKGRVLPELLNSLLGDAYFRQPPPKSAGREQFGEAFAQRLITWGRKNKARAADLIRTATMLTPLSIVDALYRFCPRKMSMKQLIVSGGGAHNPLMMAQLAAALGGVDVTTSDALGIPGDAKEAFAFAILAYETIHRRTGNLPSATGASRGAILGKVSYAPPR